MASFHESTLGILYELIHIGIFSIYLLYVIKLFPTSILLHQQPAAGPQGIKISHCLSYLTGVSLE